MSDSNDIDVSELANEYLERCRAGERPQVNEYAKKYPALAEEIREVFPMLLLMEDNAPDVEPASQSSVDPLEQLGDFRILQEIGRGGMGVVYEAIQESLGRHVALKVCPISARLSTKNQERFRRESRAAAMLHHTNIVPVFAVGEENGMLFYAMQYIRGATLDEVIQELRLFWECTPTAAATLSRLRINSASVSRERAVASEVAQSLAGSEPSVSSVRPNRSDNAGAEVSLPGQSTTESQSGSSTKYWGSVAKIGIQVAEALGYAHEQGTLHRDIKPANLMLDAAGAVWVMDFGLAKSMEEDNLTQTGELIGTMRYMSPEQCAGESNACSDIYSLGLTLYEMLALRPAFAELNKGKLLRAISETDPVPPRKINPAVPRDLETVVLKSIEREPSRRYQSATALAEDLNRFLNGEPILARPITVMERFAKWVRRRPMVAALTSALALLFVVSFGLVTWKWQEASMARDEAVATAEESSRLALSLTSLTDIGRAREILASLEDSAKDRWEWGYLNQLVHQEKFAIQIGEGETPWIWSLAFSQDESLLAVGSGRPCFTRPIKRSPTGRVAILDTKSGELVCELPITDSAYSLAFSPDGSTLVVSETHATEYSEAAWHSVVWLWDINSQRRVQELDVQDPATQKRFRATDLMFTPNGTHVVGTLWKVGQLQPAEFAVWTRADGKKVGSLPNAEFLEFEGDDIVVAIRTDNAERNGTVAICRCSIDSDADTGLTAPSIEHTLPAIHQATAAVNIGNQQRLWSTPLGQLMVRDPSTNGDYALWGGDQHRIQSRHYYRPICAFHPTNDAFATGSASDGTIRLWRTSRKQDQREFANCVVDGVLPGHTRNVQCLTYSPSGTLLASGDWDGFVRLWEPETPPHVIDTQIPGSANGCLVEAMSFSNDASRIVACKLNYKGSSQLLTVDFEASRIDARRLDISHPCHDSDVSGSAFDANGRVMVSKIFQTKTIHITDVASGKKKELSPQLAESPLEISVSADGKRFACGAATDQKHKPNIAVWQIETPQADEPFWTDVLPGFEVTAITMDADGKRIAVARQSTDRSTFVLEIIDITRNKRINLAGIDQKVSAVEFSPDGKRLAACAEGDWDGGPGAIFDCDTGESLVLFHTPGGIQDLSFSPDGSRLAGANRETVTLWNSQGRDVIILKSDPRYGDLQWDPIVLFSPDGTRIAATQWNNKIRVWNSR